MKKIYSILFYLGFNLLILPLSLQAQTPFPRFWYQANLNASSVLNNFNGTHCFRSDSSVHFDRLPAYQPLLTAFVVYRTDDNLAERGIWQLRFANDSVFGLTTRRIVFPDNSIPYSQTNRLKRVLHSIKYHFKDPIEEGATLTLGYSDSLHYNGLVSEYLLFDTVLSGINYSKWQSYLGIKYGITLKRTNYYNSNGEVVWNYDRYPHLSHRIIGLGYDTVTGLNQRQAITEDSLLEIGYTSSRYQTPEHGSALVFGTDSAGFAARQSLYLKDGTTLSCYGTGCVQRRNYSREMFKTDLIVDGSRWDEDLEQLMLIIDRSGNGDFSPENIDFYAPASVDTLGRIYYTDILWDTDNNGVDIYCFGKITDTNTVIALRTKSAKMDNTETETNNDTGMDNGSKMTYSVYPNPNNGVFYLEIIDAGVPLKINIYSPDGKSVYQNQKTESGFTLPLHLPIKGDYLLEISGTEIRESIKIVVQ